MSADLRRTWAEIDLDRLEHNYRLLREKMGTAKFLGVVKANAYGHGAVAVAKKLEELGADYLAVAEADEAAELRENGIRLPILLLGYTPPEVVPMLLRDCVTQDVPDLETAQAYSAEAQRCGGTLKVHLKLDTGMGRLGFPCDDTYFEESLQKILKAMELPNLDWEGVFTHFCVSDMPEREDGKAFTEEQFRRFRRMVDAVEAARGKSFAIHHCANSGAVLYEPEYAWDLCRPGIVLYGTERMSAENGLLPVMTLKSTIGPVKEYASGTTVSYGRTYCTDGIRRIGVVTIGYADGLRRNLSNGWSVMTKDGPAPICGRICMDMCMVDLTDLPNVGTGDEVEIFGADNPIEDMAEQLDTITYELLCAVAPRVPRRYRENGQLR